MGLAARAPLNEKALLEVAPTPLATFPSVTANFDL